MNEENSIHTTEITPDLLREWPLPQYADDTDKAGYGKLLLVAGSRRVPGAAILAARAALRAGCGSIRVAAPESVAAAIGTQVPELMMIPLPETKTGSAALDGFALIKEQWAFCDAAVIGPGMDDDEETGVLLRRLAVEMPLPTVLDASALTAIKESSPGYAYSRVMTPHHREFETLLGSTLEALKVTREEAAANYARKENAVLVLKGRSTLVAAGEKLFKNNAGTRGLGTAGSGDVLAGTIGGLLTQFAAQNLDNGDITSALWGVHLHALSGEAAGKDLGDDGMTASDLIGRLPGVLRYLRKFTAPKVDTRTGLRPVA